MVMDTLEKKKSREQKVDSTPPQRQDFRALYPSFSLQDTESWEQWKPYALQKHKKKKAKD